MTQQIPQAISWKSHHHLLTLHRQKLLIQVLEQRTRGLRLVLQDIHEAHNVSASVRSADAIGVQYVDIVNMREKFKLSTVSRGANKWLTISKYKEIAKAAEELKKNNFKLAAAVVHKESLSLEELPLDVPLAVIFGNEHDGISPEWDDHLDYRFKIPMQGMVESFNISVAVAISLYTLRAKQLSLGLDFSLDAACKEELLNLWIRQHLTPRS